MRVSDVTPEYLATLDYQQMETLAAQVEQMGYAQTANMWRNQWATMYKLRETEDDDRRTEQANDPVRLMTMMAGGHFLGSGARAAGSSLWDSIAGTDSSPGWLSQGWDYLTGGGSGASTGATGGTEAMDLASKVPWQTGYESMAGIDAATGTGGAGSVGATSGGTLGSTGATGTGSTGAGSTLGSAAPYLGAALVSYLAGQEALSRHDNLSHQNQDPMQGAEAGYKEWWNDVSDKPLQNWWQMNPFAPQASVIQGVVESVFGSGKSWEQMMREAGVGRMEEAGMLPEDDMLHFSDSGTYDLGQNDRMLKGGEYDGQRHFYDVDWNNKLSGSTVGALDPLASILFAAEGDDDFRAQMVGMMTNAALEGADPQSRINDMWTNAGYTGMEGRNRAYNQILDLATQGFLTPEERNAELAAIDARFGVVNPNQGKGGREEFGDNWIPGT